MAVTESELIVRIHRIHTPLALEPREKITLTDKPAHYLGRVLRVAPGQTVVLFNGDGCDYACEVETVGKNALTLDVLSRLPAKPESPLRITVAQAVGRGERMDLALQKCTELGATAFQPLWSERVEVRLKGEKLAKRLSHWQSVVVSASEQCGRAVIPQVLPLATLTEWVARPFDGHRLVLEPGSDESLAATQTGNTVQLAIGPEGGFSDAELELMTSKGMKAVHLGPRVLRTETAAPAAVAILQALKGDF